MHVPLTDLATQYRRIRKEIDAAVCRVFDAADFTNSTYVRLFENKFAAIQRVNECVAVNNGTSALHASLLALEVGPGDEVIVPSHTFIATPLAVSLTGATPVFADCDPVYFTIDAAHAASLVTPRTRAIIPVHLYGQMAPMDPLQKIKEISLVEDCAQAHLASQYKRSAGSIGTAGCFSFYPVKNLGAFGEGGAVTSNDEALAQKVRKIRTYGSEDKFRFELTGHNYRMEELQGSILEAKLPFLGEWTARRQEIAAIYENGLSDIPEIGLPATAPGNVHVYHLFVIKTTQRDALRSFLQKKDIVTGLHYPVPCHLQPVYTGLGYAQGDLPVTEEIAGQVLSLPMSESHTDQQIDYVISSIREFYRA